MTTTAEHYKEEIKELEQKLKKARSQKIRFIQEDNSKRVIEAVMSDSGGLSIDVDDDLSYEQTRKFAMWLNKHYLSSQ